jgi:hypothetical protein
MVYKLEYLYYKRNSKSDNPFALFRRVKNPFFYADKTVSIYDKERGVWKDTSAWMDYEFEGYLKTYDYLIHEITREELKKLILTLKLVM